MYPTLFSLFGYPVKTYGFFLATAHFAGLTAILLLARQRRLKAAPLIDLFFLSIVVGLIGARGAYVATHWSEFSGDLAGLFSLQKGGLSLFGGFIPAFFAAVLLLRARRLPLFEYADALCPALPFSVALIRLGCFGQGCCYGAPLEGFWAVTYTSMDSMVPPALRGLPLHPTQLYEVVFLLTLAAVTLYLGGRARKVPGLVGTFTVFAYCVFRFWEDFHRGDIERGALGLEWLGLTQALAVVGMLAAPAVAWLCVRARGPAE